MIDGIAEDERRAGQPGDPSQRGEVGANAEVAVAAIPGGNLEARHRLHLHIHRQQIIADVHLVDDVVEKEMPGHPLANQAALHISHAHEHGVDLAVGDELAEGFEV